MNNFMQIMESKLVLLTLTIGVYLGATYLYKKTRFFLFHPLLLAVGVIIFFLKVTGIDYETYMSANEIIDFMLGLTVVAIGYLLYEQIFQFKGHLATIITATVVGSLVGIVSVVLIARWLGASPDVVTSLQPKSATTAIALAVSTRSGGIPALTSVVVIIAGIFGGVAGPYILKKTGIENKIAKGLALGSAAHAMGTARAMELGAVEGAVSGLAIGLMGVVTALMVPLVELFL